MAAYCRGILFALSALPFAYGQCPASCRPGSGFGCFPPRCGPKCCSYYKRKKLEIMEPALSSNATLPEWVKACEAVQPPQVFGCASHWPARKILGPAADAVASTQGQSATAAPREPPVVLFSLFKNVRVADLVRFVEYHLLLGVDHVVLVDNSCGAHAEQSRAALAPYVAAGLATTHTQFVCTELRAMMFMHNFRGGSSMARQLSGSSIGIVMKGAFVVSLDDDEYLVLSDPASTLRDMRGELDRKRVCAITLPWRVFGSMGHRCQPAGSLLGSFVRRAHTEREVRGKKGDAEAGRARAEARRRHLNTPYGGKPMFIYQEPTTPQCGTHWCDSCPSGLTNCALPEGPGIQCEKRLNLTSTRMWINHYAFQSATRAWLDRLPSPSPLKVLATALGPSTPAHLHHPLLCIRAGRSSIGR